MSFAASTAEVDVFLQVGKVSKGPLLNISKAVLHNNFLKFTSFNLDRTTVEEPSIFTCDQLDHQAWVILMSIVHRSSDVQAGSFTFNTLKTAAAYADKFKYHGRAARDVEWVDARLNDFLPPDRAEFPKTHTASFPDDNVRRIFDVLCMAYTFGLRNVFARASRQLMWTARPHELSNWLFFDLGQLLRTQPTTNFHAEFNKINDGLRKSLFSKLPQVFYPEPHGENGGPGDCSKCSTTPHERRWYLALVQYNEVWKFELPDPPFSHQQTALGSLHTSFSGMISEMQAMSRASSPPEVQCGHFTARHLDVSGEALLTEVYASIGGLCLNCVQKGDFSFKSRWCGNGGHGLVNYDLQLS